jgi:hypothetical protein
MTPLEASEERRELWLWGTFAAWLVFWSLAVGAVSGVQVGVGLTPFSGLKYASRVLTLGSVREYAAGICSGAVCIALVFWSHGLAREQTRRFRRRVMLSLALAGLLGYFASAGLCLAAGSATLAAFGVGWLEFWLPALEILGWGDLASGLEGTLLQTLVVLGVCWPALPWLGERYWSLIVKVLLTWSATALAGTLVYLLRDLIVSAVGGR